VRRAAISSRKAIRAVAAQTSGSTVSSAGCASEPRGAADARGWTTCASGAVEGFAVGTACDAAGGTTTFTVPPGRPKSAAQYHLYVEFGSYARPIPTEL